MGKNMEYEMETPGPFEGHIGIEMGYSPNNGQSARKVLEATI